MLYRGYRVENLGDRVAFTGGWCGISGGWCGFLKHGSRREVSFVLSRLSSNMRDTALVCLLPMSDHVEFP